MRKACPFFNSQAEIPDEQESGCVCAASQHQCVLFQPGGETLVYFTAEMPLRITRKESETP